MKHYEERLEQDLQEIRTRVAALCATVDHAVGDAVQALLRFDRKLASRVILGDYAVNRTTRDIDGLCHVFVALHLPSAGILRYVSSVLRLTREVERVGDYAVGIAREAVQLTQPPPAQVASDFEILCRHCQHLLQQAMRAFNESNAELARATKETALHEEAIFDRVYADLLREGEKGSRPIRDLYSLLSSFRRLVRISDQAKNVCEETLFAETGEAKGPKLFRVLFLDETNDFRSVMAEAIARKSFSDSGYYDSAGWEPAAEVRPEVIAFLDQHGHETAQLAPRTVPTYPGLAAYQVIVSLAGDALAHLQEIPFHTALVEWELGHARADARLDQPQLEAAYKDLSVRLRDLMATLQGKTAD